MRFDLWAAMSWGQNLDVKELSCRNLDVDGPKGDDANSARGHGLNHDRASLMLPARSDVTRALWKSCSRDVLKHGLQDPAQAALDGRFSMSASA